MCSIHMREPTVITTKTTLVLGAGASVHLGYPLGQKLIDEIRDRINNATERERLVAVKQEFTDAEMEDFRDRLVGSQCDSIDGFLENNPKDMRMGQLLIAYCLRSCEHSGLLTERPDCIESYSMP